MHTAKVPAFRTTPAAGIRAFTSSFSRPPLKRGRHKEQLMQTVSRRHLAPWAAAAALALAPLFVPMAAHAQNGFKIVASGLNNPHGLTFGADGSLYIAEAGTGGNGASLKSGDGSIVSYGATGSVTRLLGGTQTRILTGLPSLGDQTTKPDPGAGATGLQDLAFGKDGSLYGVIGLGANTSLQAGAGPNFATLVKLDPTTNSIQKIADLGAFETKNNPDGTATDSNPYSLAVLADGSFAVADAGGNDIVGISADGSTLSTLGVLPTQPNSIFPIGPPQIQGVPAGLVVGPDGASYVGELTGFPYPVGGASVYRLDPKTGVSTVVAEGFTNIGDLTFGPDGKLYVLEISTNGLASPNGPGTGALIAVDTATGKQTSLATTGLFLPTGLTAGPDNALYISNLGVSPGGGQVLRYGLTPVPEASTTLSLGLMLALGGLAFAVRRRKAAP